MRSEDMLGYSVAAIIIALIAIGAGLTAAFFLWPFWHVAKGLGLILLIGFVAWWLLANKEWRTGP